LQPSRTFYVVIRGPLGVGKSTIADRLSKEIGAHHVSIDQILEDHDLWSSGRLSEFLKANAVAAKQARRSLGRGVPVIFDGNFYWITQIDDLVGRLDHRHFIFTLKAPLAVCIQRDRGRDHPYGPLAARAVCAKSMRFRYGVDVDATRPIPVILRTIRSHFPQALPPSLDEQTAEEWHSRSDSPHRRPGSVPRKPFTDGHRGL
jgi:predicted kinase